MRCVVQYRQGSCTQVTGEVPLSDIRANFEVGIWKDFSNEHRALREAVEQALADYKRGRRPDPIGVWGAYGAGKTQFLFWVAERAIELGLVPIYLHLNDLVRRAGL